MNALFFWNAPRFVVFIALLITIAGISLALTSSPNFSNADNSVGLKLAFHIGDSKSGEAFTVEETYIIAEDSNITAGMISVSGTSGTQLDESYSSPDYSLEMRSYNNAIILLTFFNGTNSSITEKLGSLGEGKILPSAIGSATYSIPSVVPVWLRLAYNDINIVNRQRIPAGASTLIITNEGRDERGLPKVSVRVK